MFGFLKSKRQEGPKRAIEASKIFSGLYAIGNLESFLISEMALKKINLISQDEMIIIVGEVPKVLKFNNCSEASLKWTKHMIINNGDTLSSIERDVKRFDENFYAKSCRTIGPKNFLIKFSDLYGREFVESIAYAMDQIIKEAKNR